MILAGYTLYKDFEIAITYRNTDFSIKMRCFEIVQDPEAYSEPCRTTKIFGWVLNMYLRHSYPWFKERGFK